LKLADSTAPRTVVQKAAAMVALRVDQMAELKVEKLVEK
jgi:hypothetical protein